MSGHLFAGASAAAVVRGRLKHSWLENEVLNKSADHVVALWRGGGWPELAGFSGELGDAMSLAERIEYGFSPALLVDQSKPLSRLAEDDRAIVREAVHRAYLEKFDAHGAARELRVAAMRMSEALTRFLAAWCMPDGDIASTVLRERWEEVIRTANGLRDALNLLPRGVVMP